MKLLILLAVCVVAINATRTIPINNFGFYWRTWNVDEEMPADAVPGGINKHGYKTFIAKTVYQQIGVLVPGKAVAEEHKMYFEFDGVEHVATQDVDILCALNANRFSWVPTKTGDSVESVVKGLVLVIGGHDRQKPVAIGKKTVGEEKHIGKVLIDDKTGKFLDMRMSQDGRGWGATDNYSVSNIDCIVNNIEYKIKTAFCVLSFENNCLTVQPADWATLGDFFFRYSLEHVATQNIDILYSLNPYRFRWVSTKLGDTVETRKFFEMRLSLDGKVWEATDNFSVLVYDNQVDSCKIA
ncbi:hypothetical protein FQA39_LY07703 [Lamprigera yunnana]|nr:hypothetical protein FQA39_LY07703 [Lamprigera yunnana]